MWNPSQWSPNTSPIPWKCNFFVQLFPAETCISNFIHPSWLLISIPWTLFLEPTSLCSKAVQCLWDLSCLYSHAIQTLTTSFLPNFSHFLSFWLHILIPPSPVLVCIHHLVYSFSCIWFQLHLFLPSPIPRLSLFSAYVISLSDLSITSHHLLLPFS